MTAKKLDIIATVGRRKGAIARVRVSSKPADTQSITVNGRPLADYFNYFELQDIIRSPLTMTGNAAKTITVRVVGGGLKAQAEAIRLGIARALVAADAQVRSTLKKAGFLTRDPRIKERKKPGLKKARRAPQWSKR